MPDVPLQHLGGCCCFGHVFACCYYTLQHHTFGIGRSLLSADLAWHRRHFGMHRQATALGAAVIAPFKQPTGVPVVLFLQVHGQCCSLLSSTGRDPVPVWLRLSLFNSPCQWKITSAALAHGPCCPASNNASQECTPGAPHRMQLEPHLAPRKNATETDMS